MDFFKAIGYFIGESGGPEVLINTCLPYLSWEMDPWMALLQESTLTDARDYIRFWQML